ncbi:MAG TPA: zinc-finger domain-containing protein [Xanthobacteraceae bacterium]|nr:zinc-finger domain-containing protein [Xanthobacteraceae bacterium]
MADHVVPHFHNTAGVSIIAVGVKEFMCVGALPPYDHPHVFLDMGSDDEIICPYCSTLYRRDASLHGTQSRPADCLYTAQAA